MRRTEHELQIAREGLAGLVGLPLVSMWRTSRYAVFDFGQVQKFVNPEGDECLSSDYELHANSDWKLEGPDGWVSNEQRDPVRREDHTEEVCSPHPSGPLLVESVLVKDDGGLRFTLSNGFFLNIDVGELMYREIWRLVSQSDGSSGQLVLDDHGLGWRKDPGVNPQGDCALDAS